MVVLGERALPAGDNALVTPAIRLNHVSPANLLRMARATSEAAFSGGTTGV